MENEENKLTNENEKFMSQTPPAAPASESNKLDQNSVNAEIQKTTETNTTAPLPAPFSGSLSNRIDLTELNEAAEKVKDEIGKIIVGQNNMIEMLLIAILSDGHVLIEGVPGVAKTLAAKLIAKTISVDFSRIQFTPDLMPSDVIGTSVFNQKSGGFEFHKGPVFSNIVLIDEINRAPAKTQAALFEVMEEKQVTFDGNTYQMNAPFVVLATQNPIEQEGTYRLPEAQLDRFLFKVEVKYPSLNEEQKILLDFHNRNNTINLDEVKSILSAKKIEDFRNKVGQVHIDEKLVNYIAQIVVSTRDNISLYLGASPRASLAILSASKAAAALRGRDFVTPDDIKFVAKPVLKHRIMLTPEKEMEGLAPDDIIQMIIEAIEIPR